MRGAGGEREGERNAQEQVSKQEPGPGKQATAAAGVVARRQAGTLVFAHKLSLPRILSPTPSCCLLKICPFYKVHFDATSPRARTFLNSHTLPWGLAASELEAYWQSLFWKLWGLWVEAGIWSQKFWI